MPHNKPVYVFEYCCSFRMLWTLAETCSSSFVNQILVQLFGNKLVDIQIFLF